jgi:hypothetical protein
MLHRIRTIHVARGEARKEQLIRKLRDQANKHTNSSDRLSYDLHSTTAKLLQQYSDDPDALQSLHSGKWMGSRRGTIEHYARQFHEQNPSEYISNNSPEELFEKFTAQGFAEKTENAIQRNRALHATTCILGVNGVSAPLLLLHSRYYRRNI